MLNLGLLYRSQFLAKCETVIFEDSGITKLSACTLNKVEVLHEVISSQRIESTSPHQVIVRQSNHYFIAFHHSSFYMLRRRLQITCVSLHVYISDSWKTNTYLDMINCLLLTNLADVIVSRKSECQKARCVRTMIQLCTT